MPTITKTAESYTPDLGLVEIQITAAMDTNSANIALGDVGTWIDISGILTSFSQTTTPQKRVTDTFVTGSIVPLSARSKHKGSAQYTGTVLDTNGKLEDFGLVGSINVINDILIPCEQNDQVIPLRYSPAGGATGDELITLDPAETYVLYISEAPIEAGSEAKATRQFVIVAPPDPTRSVVA